MRLPEKVKQKILDEALKNARFRWHQGWQSSSGYISSELRGDCRFGATRIYIKWEKKKEPTPEQSQDLVKKYIDSLLANEQHHQTQKDFAHYVMETFYLDLNRLKHQAMLSVIDNLPLLISNIEKGDIEVPSMSELHNDLKNLESALSEHEAVSAFLERGRKRVGET